MTKQHWLGFGLAFALGFTQLPACSSDETLVHSFPDAGTPDGNAGDASPASVTLTILQTTDLHTNVMPWDYFSAKDAKTQGLAKVATLVKRERTECSLLIDSGDTIQGTPLGTYYALKDNAPKHPMAAAMESLKYDAMALGNHEFNYGLGVLNKFIGEVNFPVLGANVRKTDGSEAFKPYVIKEVCGVKVGILGMVTPGVTTWERPENIPGLRFDNPLDTAKVYVPQLRAAGADVVVLSFHSGPDKQPPGNATDPAVWLTDYSTWTDRGNLPNENLAVQIAQQVPGIDVILSGHTHQPIPKMLIGDVILSQPNRWGSHLGKVTIGASKASGAWKVVSRDSTLVPVTEDLPVDETVAAAAKSYHETTLAYVDAKIGTSAALFPNGFPARYTDSALADLINIVQEEAAEANGHKVDLSLAAVFSNNGGIPQGDVKLRDAYSIYVYDNTLYVMEITGDILRRALEKDALYFTTLDASKLPDQPAQCKAMPNGPDYNWDIYSKIEYTIDATKPEGARVTSLKFNGNDVTPTQKFTIAINNYRGGGGGGYDMFKEGTIVWKSADGVRDFVADYVTRLEKNNEKLDPAKVNTCNFKLVPDLYTKYFSTTPGPTKCSP
ncbi:5'-nucleotidase C-terminal domain-containing protein [Pendulispora brunnea]|uniref:5'-nucleotidase C-terminal domain-containing protein n=1 Tax=Pendulispora brunnea TaxID=2905690 RepID=A0ABZ2K2P7_9BACT